LSKIVPKLGRKI